MPDPLHWLGVTRIHRFISMSDMKVSHRGEGWGLNYDDVSIGRKQGCYEDAHG